ncbi:MAG: DUF5666 domain-containing protein [Pseudomonadota bacterium]
MNSMAKKRAALLLLASSFLAACGGGGSSTEPAPPAPTPPPQQGITGNGIAVGPITTFGSVVVNGIRYETNAATVFDIDGSPTGSESDLRVGDTVQIVAEIDQGSGTATALEVIYDDAITGPVDSKNDAAQTLSILGQTVLITAETSFDDDFADPSFEGIAIGQIVEVSGSPNSNGVIVASRVEPEASGTTLELRGVVSSLDAVAQTFQLGTLVVDFSSAVLEEFPNGMISDGDLVDAKGNSTGANGELIATEIEFEDDFPDLVEDDFVELEGFITRFVSSTDFDVAGFPVTTNAQTEFEEGVAADLAIDVLIEVEGLINANGVLLAQDIEFRIESDIEIFAAVDSIDVASNTVVVLGIPVILDDLTKIEDNSDFEIDPLTLADINAGDFLEIVGNENPLISGQIEAALVERDDADDTGIVGFVSAVSQPALTVLGVTIETDANTEFTDSDDNELTAAEFFAAVAVGSEIEATGTESSDTTLVASEVSLED